MKRMRKCNDEIYQLAKDQALVKKLKKTKDLGLFVYALRMQCLQLADPKTLFYVFDSLSNLDCGQ
jgi:hypothetical protein